MCTCIAFSAWLEQCALLLNDYLKWLLFLFLHLQHGVDLHVAYVEYLAFAGSILVLQSWFVLSIHFFFWHGYKWNGHHGYVTCNVTHECMLDESEDEASVDLATWRFHLVSLICVGFDMVDRLILCKHLWICGQSTHGFCFRRSKFMEDMRLLVMREIWATCECFLIGLIYSFQNSAATVDDPFPWFIGLLFSNGWFMFLVEPNVERPSRPCDSSPCGTNALCNDQNNAFSCVCPTNYVGDPYSSCRPECVLNTDCPREKSCVRNQCIDPCPGTCGINSECRVSNHIPICSCKESYTGDPYGSCRPIPTISKALMKLSQFPSLEKKRKEKKRKEKKKSNITLLIVFPRSTDIIRQHYQVKFAEKTNLWYFFF